MKIKHLVLFILLLLPTLLASSQVRIRIFAGQAPESAVFSVTEGEYTLNAFIGQKRTLAKGTLLVVSRFSEKLVIKIMNERGFICDSILLTGKTGNDKFSLRSYGKTSLRQYYSGDLQCIPDLATLVFINICDIESYLAGVVMAEGGSGKFPEYFKSQAVIARTYMYRNMDKHVADRFNLCDNTHCQAYNGLTDDPVIIRATLETRDEVILGPDSALIISAFHSNCGGETSPSEDVWLTAQPYLKKVSDPHCSLSRNARWSKTISLNDWTAYLKKSGYQGDPDNNSLLNFSQNTRSNDYKTGSFLLPLRQIRTDLNLRSTFFSLTVKGDSVNFSGRGYGHGVGLCQEGAMSMAAKGFSYRQIIDFYYTGVSMGPPIPPAPLKLRGTSSEGGR